MQSRGSADHQALIRHVTAHYQADKRIRAGRGVRLDPAEPGCAVAQVIAETAADFEFGPRRAALLARIGVQAR